MQRRANRRAKKAARAVHQAARAVHQAAEAVQAVQAAEVHHQHHHLQIHQNQNLWKEKKLTLKLMRN